MRFVFKLSSQFVTEFDCFSNISFIQDVENDDRRLVKEFIEIVHAAEQIHETRLSLESLGYWPIRCRSRTFPESKFGLKLKFFTEQMEELKTIRRNWKSAIANARAKEPRLFFLNAAALGQFGGTLERVLLKTAVSLDLIPFLWLCFPDYMGVKIFSHADLSAGVINQSLVIDVLHQSAKDLSGRINTDFFKPGTPPEHIIELLQHFTSLLNERVVNTLKEVDDEDYRKLTRRVMPYPDLEVKKYVFPDESNTPMSFFTAVVALMQQEPHPSLVLNCSPSSTTDDLLRFLDAAAHFKDLLFVVLGVNRLQPQVRQELLARVSGDYKANLCLFFIGDSGIFSDIPDLTQADIQLDASNLVQLVKPKVILESRKVNTCQVFIPLAPSFLSLPSSSSRDDLMQHDVLMSKLS